MKKEIVLGVTGGIAAYKALDIVRRLRDEGLGVRVIMTRAACQFIRPLTFQTLSNRKVATELFDFQEEDQIGHIELAEKADMILVAPATANILAKMRAGLADDLLSTVLLAATCPVVVAPAMNDHMWQHPATQENLRILTERQVEVIPPEEGFLACGKVSIGRMAAPQIIAKTVLARLEQSLILDQKQEGKNRQLLQDVSILVTAGPTREAIDPVRYLSNYSSGKMGYAIARQCALQGAKVTLVSGPVALPAPAGVKVIPVTSTQEMLQKVISRSEEFKVIIKAAAVSDFRVEHPSIQKEKKQTSLNLKLIRNPDILEALGAKKRTGQIIVGFAAETQHLLENARGKMVRKNLDMIVANDVTKEGAGFNTDTNIVTILTRDSTKELSLMSKDQVARKIIDAILALPAWEEHQS